MDDTSNATPSQTEYALVPTVKAARSHPDARTLSRRGFLVALTAFSLGVGAGYLYRDRIGQPAATLPAPDQLAQAPTYGPPPRPESTPTPEISLPASYTAPVEFGEIGPQLVKSGAIDLDVLSAAYAASDQPLTAAQRDILWNGSREPVSFTPESAYYLLNFFWALGLANRNPILLDGPLPQYAGEAIDRFASTGGWTAGSRPVTELYASQAIVELTPVQQARVEEVATVVYRPCCDNSTLFPDCNHGMAMLGLLELAAAKDASTEELFDIAKHANAFWFPQQMLEVTTYVHHRQGTAFADTAAAHLVGPNIFSASGFRQVHQWLADNGGLQQTPKGGGGCSL